MSALWQPSFTGLRPRLGGSGPSAFGIATGHAEGLTVVDSCRLAIDAMHGKDCVNALLATTSESASVDCADRSL